MNSGLLPNLDSGLHLEQLLCKTKTCKSDIHGVGQHQGGVHVLLHLRAVVGSACVIHQMKGHSNLIQKMALGNPIDPILDLNSGCNLGIIGV